MNVFGVTIDGTHDTMARRRYFGLAGEASTAILLAKRAAIADGFSNPRVDDLSCLGTLTFSEADLKKGVVT